MFTKITIIGVGLIGGSIGLALHSKPIAKKIVGVDADQDNLKLALEIRAVDEVTPSPEEGVMGADLIILATPVGQTIKVLREIIPYLDPGTVITDVGSTKSEVIKQAEELLPAGIYFVGGHPMAGSEISGVQGADRSLFENAYYLIARTEKTAPAALMRVKELVKVLGARVVELEPQVHDQAVAVISHLPHLAAVTLVNTLAGIPQWDSVLPLAAGGFRDTTRIALGSPVMWRDIFLSNRNKVLEVLSVFNEQLARISDAISKSDGEKILELLKQANEVRTAVPGKTKGYLPTLFEIVVTVPDRPGMIAKIAGCLEKTEINIIDIEILRVREGPGGTIRLALGDEKAQRTAAQVLTEEGFQVRVLK